ncbi:MAG: VWA domain-containing protein [Gammaproteobacteria bacterium]|nr:VWA domain-containing protein [Gammaproteobacteria bacterium]MDH3859899.1 VWA domain-containing protein [Gammaproteobacteria bacterium]
MTGADKDLPQKSTKVAIDAFVKQVRSTPVVKSGQERGRLIFAMDATASREPTWDQACQIQGEMFTETAALGGLDIQLCYYRGFGEFEVSPWLSSADDLLHRMTSVSCRGGYTQIEKVLRQAIEQTRQKKVQALVFVGDCVEEDVDRLCHLAGELGMLGVPAFLFHEGEEPVAQRAFKEFARLTRGACCCFDATSAGQLRDLLSAVAVYAAGGQKALQDFSQDRSEVVRQLTRQMGKD